MNDMISNIIPMNKQKISLITLTIFGVYFITSCLLKYVLNFMFSDRSNLFCDMRREKFTSYL